MSTDEYTPTTDKVRLDYAYLGGRSDETEFDRREPEFDRWLRKVQAEAWDEGHDAGHYDTTWDNPYLESE